MPPKTYCCRSYRFTQTQQNFSPLHCITQRAPSCSKAVACRRSVNHEFECHKVVVNAIDKLRLCSSNTMNDSNCLVPVSVSAGNGGATATITAGTPTTCDNTASVGSYDTVAAFTVAATASDDSDNTAAVSSDVTLPADTTAAGATIVSDDSDNTSSFSSYVAPSGDAIAAGTAIISGCSSPAVAPPTVPTWILLFWSSLRLSTWRSCYPPATSRRPIIAGRWCCCDPHSSGAV